MRDHDAIVLELTERIPWGDEPLPADWPYIANGHLPDDMRADYAKRAAELFANQSRYLGGLMQQQQQSQFGLYAQQNARNVPSNYANIAACSSVTPSVIGPTMSLPVWDEKTYDAMSPDDAWRYLLDSGQ